MDDRLVALVTGGSSGIGAETVRAFVARGVRVWEFSRREKTDLPEEVRHRSVDVTDEAAVRRAVEELIAREGRLDLVVNCAGYGISGAVEFTELSAAKEQFNVNFFGTVNVNRAALPVLREQKRGRIVNVSSVASPVPIPFQAFYSASKAAVDSYTCALANEVRPFGITVTAVRPGDVATGFTDARKKSAAGDDLYGGRIGRSVAGMERDERRGLSAAAAGRYVVKIALKRKVKPFYAFGASYKWICVLCKVLPAGVQNRIVGKLYAK